MRPPVSAAREPVERDDPYRDRRWAAFDPGAPRSAHVTGGRDQEGGPMAEGTTASVVEAAGAILMGALRIGPDQALELLVRAARREDVALDELAARVVELRAPRLVHRAD